MTLSRTLILTAAALAVAACATTPTPTTMVASSSSAGLRINADQAAPATSGLFSQSWVKDEDAKDKNGPDGLSYR